MSAPPPPDPPSTATTTTTATATTTATTRLFSSTLPPQRPQPQPNSLQRLPQQQHHHYIQTQRVHHHPHPQHQKVQDPHHQNSNSNNNILYPVASSGRGFLPRPLPSAARNNLTTTPPYPFQPPSYGLPPNSDPHMAIRPPTHYFPGGPTGMLPLSMVRGVPVSTNPKVTASPSSVSDGNGFKDIRERSRDDNVATVRDRKVKFSEGSSLYSLCRSWVKNGISEENKPQYTDCVKSLPKPLPAPVTDANSQSKKKDEIEEEVEDVENVDNLSSKELLQGHIKRAKKVRARLREERQQRIARYKGRLALLLPPVVEQQLKNDSASAN